MQLSAYSLLLLAAMIACVVAQRPNTNFTTTFTANGLNANLTLRVGDNVSLACSYANSQWSVQIVRFHPDNSQLNKDGSRRTLPLVIDKNFAGDFVQLLQQFPDLAARFSNSYDASSNTAYFKITDFQYEDIGEFGCYAISGLQTTQISSLTLDSNDKVLYVDINGTQQQVMDLSQSTQVKFNCSLYHVRGLQNAASLSSFKRCDLFDAQGTKLTTPICTSDSFEITQIGSDNFTDPNRYGEFWPRSLDRTTVQTTVTLDQTYYNKSIGCYAVRNQDKSVSDFVTLTKPGVDLHLDPAIFDCSPHHVQRKQNEYAEFSCVVTEPLYRKFDIFWVVEVPPSNAGQLPKTYNCAGSTSCRLNDLIIEDPQNVSSNAYVNKIRAKARVRVTSTTSQYKLRLVASYLNSKQFTSDNFTMKIPPVTVDTGAVKKGAAAVLHTSLWSLAAVVLLVLFNL